MRDATFNPTVAQDHERRLKVLEDRDLRNAEIVKGGITVGSAFVGELPDGTLGLGYIYDGELISAEQVAALHKANLAAQQTELSSQAGSIHYLAGIATTHSNTLAAHGGSISFLNNEVSNQAGSILSVASALGTTNGRVGSLESAVSGLQSTVGGMPDYGSIISTLVGKVSFLEGKVNHIENYLSGGGTGPFNPGA